MNYTKFFFFFLSKCESAEKGRVPTFLVENCHALRNLCHIMCIIHVGCYKGAPLDVCVCVCVVALGRT